MMRWPLNAASSDVVTVYARRLADPEKVLAAASALGTGETFCATAADDDESADGASGFAAFPGFERGAEAIAAPGYSATISDTVATFVIDVTQDPLFGELPDALEKSGWSAASLTAYQISVASLGPGSDRLRYRLAKALLEVTGGVLVGSDGTLLAVESLADATWGSLW